MLFSALPVTAGGWLLRTEGTSCPFRKWEGGDAMVTYSELFSYSLFIIGVIGLVIQITKKK